MIANLQLLRAFAAISVVIYHVLNAAKQYGAPAHYLAFLEGWGARGVDIFFVISGFVMVYCQATTPKSSVEFWCKRLVRIVPLYWLFTWAVIALRLAAPTLFLQTHEVTVGDAISSLYFASNVATGNKPLLYVGWTLEYEMLFYGLFALGVRFRMPIFSVAALLALAFSGVYDFVVIEFVFGMAAAAVYLRHDRIRWAAGLFAGSAFTFAITPGYYHPALAFGVPAAAVVLCACYIRQLKHPLPMLLGDASYSIYLVQVFTIPVFYKVSSVLLSWLPNDMLAILCLIDSVIAGVLVHHLLEKPLTRRIKQLSFPSPAVPATQGA